MPTRRWTVAVRPDEAARLRTYDNKTQAGVSWPLGPNRSFRRRGRQTFVVKDYSSMGPGKALVTNLGKAVLRDDDHLDVVVKTTGRWVGWLLVAIGVLVLAVVPRDGLVALAFAVVLVAAGWGVFLHRPRAEAELDAVEQVLRCNIDGEWTPVDRQADG